MRRSWKTLPKPLRPPEMGDIAFQPPSAEHVSVKSEGSASHSSSYYPERSSYKNISIYVTKLPSTPFRRYRSRHELFSALWKKKTTLKSGKLHHQSELPSSGAFSSVPPPPIEWVSPTKGPISNAV